MKAIRKEDGKEIEVRIYTEKQYVSTEVEDGEIGRCIYREDALIIDEAVDWDAYRREVAGKVLASIAARPEVYAREANRPISAVKDAMALTDELIKQLKR